jgi:predicted RNA-binding Zn ribbon-like protein
VTIARQDAELLEALNGESVAASSETAAVLRDLAETVAAGKTLAPAQLARLNALLRLTPVEARIRSGGDGRYVLDLEPVGGSAADRAARELAGAFGSLLRRAPDRLRRCEECDLFFLDSTRSHTQRFCDSRTCGNRARVRAHRARHEV